MLRRNLRRYVNDYKTSREELLSPQEFLFLFQLTWGQSKWECSFDPALGNVGKGVQTTGPRDC